MDQTDEDIDAEVESMNYHDYTEGGGKDDFQTWKMKKYVDDKFLQYFLMAIGAIIGILIVQRFL